MQHLYNSLETFATRAASGLMIEKGDDHPSSPCRDGFLGADISCTLISFSMIFAFSNSGKPHRMKEFMITKSEYIF